MRRTDHRDQSPPNALQAVKPSTPVPPRLKPQTPIIHDLKPPTPRVVTKAPLPSPYVPVTAPEPQRVKDDANTASPNKLLKPRKAMILAIMTGVLIVATIGVGGILFNRATSNASTEIAGTALGGSGLAVSKSNAPAGTNQQSDPAVTLSYALAPEDLRQAIAIVMARDYPACIIGSNIIDTTGNRNDPEIMYSEAGFARTELGCDDSSAYLLVRPGGTWQDVDAAAEHFDCEVVDFYRVPKAVIGQGRTAKCMGNDGLRSYL